MSWAIRREDDSERSFSDAHIVDARRQLVQQGASYCDLEFGYGDFTTPSPFAVDEIITILRDDVPWFVGRNRGPAPRAQGQSETYSVRLGDAWDELERTTYMQRRPFVTDPDANPEAEDENGLTISDFTTENLPSSWLFLGQDDTGRRVDSRGQVVSAINYAIAQGAHLQLGTIDAGRAIPIEEFRGASCAQVIQAALRWTPGQAAWIDYTTSPPTIHVRKRVNRSTITIDFADGEITGVDLREQHQSRAAGIRIEYVREHSRDGFNFRTLDVDEAGPDPRGVGGLVVPIALFGSYLAGDAIVEGDTVPEGLADELWEIYSEAPIEGTVGVVGEALLDGSWELSNRTWVGQRLSLQGLAGVWSGHLMDIQGATSSVARSTTDLIVGPPNHLSAQDMVALMRRTRAEVPSVIEATIAGGGGSPAQPPFSPSTTEPRLIFGPGRAPDLIIHTYGRINAAPPGGGGGTIYGDSTTLRHPTFGDTIISPGALGRVPNKSEVAYGVVLSVQPLYIIPLDVFSIAGTPLAHIIHVEDEPGGGYRITSIETITPP